MRSAAAAAGHRRGLCGRVAVLAFLLFSAVLLFVPPSGSAASDDYPIPGDIKPDRERLNRELDQYRQLAKSEPFNALAWVKVGVTLQEMDHHMPDGGRRVLEAVKAYSTALQLGLADEMAVSIYSNMGALLMGAGHSEKAIQGFDAGIELARKKKLDMSMTGGLLYNRGKAYGYIAQADMALSSYREAVEVTKGKDPHIYSLAIVSMGKNVDSSMIVDLNNAVNYLEGRYDALEPTEDVLSQLSPKERQKPKNSSSIIKATARHLSWLESIHQTDRAYLHFGLYTAYVNQKEFDKAWEKLAKGNELYRQTLGSYSLDQENQMLQMLMSVFRGKYGGSGYKDPTPIFVTGVPRSGSTLIEQILASHSQVWGAGEDTAMAPIIGEMMTSMHGVPLAEQGAMVGTYGSKYVDEMRSRLPASHRHATRIVDKMLRNLWNVGHIHMMLPDSCIIHAVRHPLDTAISCFEQPFEGRGTPWAWDLNEIGQYVLMNHAIARHWDKVNPGRVLTVMYEDLVANQEAVSRSVFDKTLLTLLGPLRRILSHCGLEFEEGVLDFHKLDRGVRTASLSQVRRQMYNTSVAKYRRYEKHIQPLMEALKPLVVNYEATLEARLKQSAAELSAATEEAAQKDEL